MCMFYTLMYKHCAQCRFRDQDLEEVLHYRNNKVEAPVLIRQRQRDRREAGLL